MGQVKGDVAVIWVKRRGEGLFPYDSTGVEEIEQYPQGRALKASIIMPRNGETNRLYQAILARLASGMGRSKESIDVEIKLRTGFVREYSTERCGIVPIPRSTSFKDCEDEIEFLQFFDRALVVIHGELDIPHSALADLMAGKNKRDKK